MKLLHVIPSFAPAFRYGGPIVAASVMVRRQAARGHEVTVVTTNIDGQGELDIPLGRPVDFEGAEVFYFPVQGPFRSYCYSGPLSVAIARRVSDFDVVHVHSIYLWPTSVAARACLRANVPYILRPAGMLDPVCIRKPYEPVARRLLSRIRKGAYFQTAGRVDLDAAAAFHFTSLGEMERASRLPAGKPSYVIPMGVEPNRPHQSSRKESLAARYPELRGRAIILFLSRIDRKKGLELLLQAGSRLSETREDFSLLIAGAADEDIRSILKEQLALRGLSSRAVVLGLVDDDDKKQLLAEADLFVLPSHQENLGLAVLEAMAAGLPVIISNQVQIRREVAESGAGVVIPMDPTELSGAIALLLDWPELRRSMGERGARLVREKFNWDHVMGELDGMYEEVWTRASANGEGSGK